MDQILAIDIGTQSLRAGILDGQLNILERQQVPLTVRVSRGTHAEMDGEDIWSALVAACKGLDLRNRVEAVVLSTLCPSLLPIDAAGRPLYPAILHLDRRSEEEARWALHTIGEETFLNIAGNLPIPGGISLTSLLWLKNNAPEIYRREDVCFGHVATLILRRLTGKFLIDPSNASFTGLYDTVGYTDWDERLYGPLDIDPDKLPTVAHSNSVAGEILPGVAADLGIPEAIPVVTGANDTTCACVGAEVNAEGDLLNTSGTVDILVLCLEKPLTSRRHLLRTHAYPGKWLAMRTVGAGGGSLEWFRKNFCREFDKEDFYSSYVKHVLKNPPPLRSSFRPFLSGNRHQVEMATASFENLTLDSTREEMLVALLDGIVSFQFEELDVWKDHVDLNKCIKHVGGGATSRYTAFKQEKLPDFKLLMVGETTLAGAARLALETLEKHRRASSET
jgi:sugar (pentulose or hexulose) kinase